MFNDVKEAVVDECTQFGKVEDVFVDEVSPEGRVYLHLDTIQAAEKTKGLLHGRWYAGKQVSVEFLTLTVFAQRKSQCTA